MSKEYCSERNIGDGPGSGAKGGRVIPKYSRYVGFETGFSNVRATHRFPYYNYYYPVFSG